MADALGMTKDELHRLQDRLFRSVVLALEHVVDRRHRRGADPRRRPGRPRAVEPPEELEHRELHAYLRDAVALLPERQRLVIVGYFLEERTSQELARFLGVTESRVSQLRSEALEMLREGIEAQYEAKTDDDGSRGSARQAPGELRGRDRRAPGVRSSASRRCGASRTSASSPPSCVLRFGRAA